MSDALSGPLWEVLVREVPSATWSPCQGSLAFVRDHTLFLVTSDERLLRVLPQPMWHSRHQCAIDALMEGFASFALVEKLQAARPGKHIRSRSRVVRLGPAELEEWSLPERLNLAPSLP